MDFHLNWQRGSFLTTDFLFLRCFRFETFSLLRLNFSWSMNFCERLVFTKCQLTFDLETDIDSDTNKVLASQVGDSGLKIPCITSHHSLRQIAPVSCISQNICDAGAFYRYSLQPLTWTKFQGTLYVIHKSVGHVASEIIENYC